MTTVRDLKSDRENRLIDAATEAEKTIARVFLNYGHLIPDIAIGELEEVKNKLSEALENV